MRKLLRMVCVVVIFAMAAAFMLAGCGEGKNAQVPPTSASSAVATGETTGEPKDAIDISKKVVIKGYMIPDQPEGSKAVYEELNKRLEKDLNCTMDLKFTGWTDLENKYAMVLASGEPLDFVYTSSWTSYAPNASKGAFKEIDMNLIQKYMPKSYKAIPPDFWKDCMVNGKIYMIPAAHKETIALGFIYREDLRKKYGAPEINKVSDIPAFLQVIKENEPSMIPYNMSKFDIGCLTSMLMQEINGCGQYGIGSGSLSIYKYSVDDPNYTLKGIFDPDYVDAYKKAAKVMKELYDKGMVPRNPYSIETRSKDVIVDGKTAVAYGNQEEVIDLYGKARLKGMELKHVMVTCNGKVASKPATTNGIAIPNSAQNAERMLMAMDLITQDESYNYLLSFGIEGKNYAITSDGKIGLPEGVTAETNDYPLHGSGWWFTNRNLWKPFATWDPNYLEQKEKLESIAVTYPLESFNPVYDNVKNELASCQNVATKYGNPISIGSVKDVDAAVSEIQNQFRLAGLEKVQAEVKKQVEAFLASRK